MLAIGTLVLWNVSCVAIAVIALAVVLVGGRRRPTSRASSPAEARFRGIVDHAAEGIVTTDAEGRIELFNRAACQMFGYEPGEVVGRSIAILAPEEHMVEPGISLHDYATRRDLCEGGHSVEIVARHKDGATFPVRLAISETPRSSEATFTAIVTDLREARRIEAQLSQAQKLESIGQLAAGIAHEINTPTQYVTDNVRFLEEVSADLEGLLGMVRELDPEQPLTAEQVKRLCELRDEADLDYLAEEMPTAIAQSLQGLANITRIVRAMKDFSHPGGQELAEIDLNQALENAVTVARNAWRYVADVETRFDPALPPVPVYEGELNQVFLNLLVNAAHAVEQNHAEHEGEKGTILISTLATHDGVEIRFVDDGCGIPQDLMQRIFDPFFTTKGVGKGTGQGLALAHSVVVDQHHGRLSVESQVGVGTTFVIHLPREQAHVDAAA